MSLVLTLIPDSSHIRVSSRCLSVDDKPSGSSRCEVPESTRTNRNDERKSHAHFHGKRDVILAFLLQQSRGRCNINGGHTVARVARCTPRSSGSPLYLTSQLSTDPIVTSRAVTDCMRARKKRLYRNRFFAILISGRQTSMPSTHLRLCGRDRLQAIPLCRRHRT